MDRFVCCEEAVEGMKNAVESNGRTFTTSSVSGRFEPRECKEVIGYSCQLSGWGDRDKVSEILGPENFEFLTTEIIEWFDPSLENPGSAWTHDTKTWKPFLKADGTFQYTYNERFFLKDNCGMGDQLENVIKVLKYDPYSRQAFVGIWSPYHDSQQTIRSGPEGRVPCTIGYHFMIRPSGDQHVLEMVYLMRSLCASWNLWNDLYLATVLFDTVRARLQEEDLSINTELSDDGLIHINAGSLHIFN